MVDDPPVEGEEWRQVATHPMYEVSNKNRWRRKLYASDNYSSPKITTKVSLRKDGKTKMVALSKLIAKAFGQPAQPQVMIEPAVRPSRSKLQQYIHLLGVETDYTVAKLAGVSHQGVASFRNKLKIPGLGAAGAHKIRRAVIAEQLGDRLASTPASTLAKDVGIAALTVSKMKKERNIPAYKMRTGDVGSNSKLTPYRHLLGTMTDSEIAKTVGVCTVYVTTFRNKLGIAPKYPKHRPRIMRKSNELKAVDDQSLT